MEEQKINWSLPEYEHREKSGDWFWALGIIIVAGAITSMLYGNFFFAMLLAIGGILIWYFARKEPEMVSYEVNSEGFMIKNRLFPYGEIKSFFVTLNPKPTFFVRTSRIFMPVISVPIEEGDAEKIKSVLLSQKITEEEMKQHVSEHIMDALGF